DTVYVVEQNRDAQMRTMLMTELDANPSRLQRVLHYDGTPITARFIIDTIARHARQTAAEAPPEAA
nr:2-oxoacid:acceptor oxidoreductase subunit alpha [Brachymonas sp.]